MTSGESTAPVELPSGVPDEAWSQYAPEPAVSEAPLDWRAVIEGAGLQGPLKMLASMSEPVTLTPHHVHLRIALKAYATESNRELLADRLSVYFQTMCRVTFEVGPLQGATVADDYREERNAKRAALLENFKADATVRRLMAIFDATVDETSVRAPGESDAETNKE